MTIQKAGWILAVLCCAGLFFLVSIEPVPTEPVMKPELREAPDFTLIMEGGSARQFYNK